MNESADDFMENHDLWANGVASFKQMLESATISVENMADYNEEMAGDGGPPVFFSMADGSAHPLIVLRKRTKEPEYGLQYTLSIKDTPVKLVYLIDKGYSPLMINAHWGE